MNRCRWWKRVLIAGLILGMGCTGRAQASSTVDLDKINAEAQIADTSVLVDTDMTNQEIIDATDLDKDAIAKYRKLWESDPARVQYYIVDMDQNDDNIMISTALSGELGLNDANDIKSSQEDQVLRNMKKKLRKSEGKISDFEKIYVGGRLSWRYFMDIKNRHTYEYQTIYIRSIHIGSCCISILIRKPAFNHCQHSTPHCILCFFKSNLLLQFHNLCLPVFLGLFLYLIFKFRCGGIFFRRICKDT